MKRDYDADWRTWLSWIDTISHRVSAIDAVKIAVREPDGLSNKSPVLVISWHASKLHITDGDVGEDLARNNPRVAVGTGGARGKNQPDPATNAVTTTPWIMQPGEDKIVAERICSLLSQKREPKPAETRRPAADLSGRWDISIESSAARAITCCLYSRRATGSRAHTKAITLFASCLAP